MDTKEFIASCESMMITEEDYACEALIDSIRKLGGKIAGLKDDKNSTPSDDSKISVSPRDTEKEIYEKVKSYYDTEFKKTLSTCPHGNASKSDWDSYRQRLAKHSKSITEMRSIAKNMKSEYRDKVIKMADNISAEIYEAINAA